MEKVREEAMRMPARAAGLSCVMGWFWGRGEGVVVVVSLGVVSMVAGRGVGSVEAGVDSVTGEAKLVAAAFEDLLESESVLSVADAVAVGLVRIGGPSTVV